MNTEMIKASVVAEKIGQLESKHASDIADLQDQVQGLIQKNGELSFSSAANDGPASAEPMIVKDKHGVEHRVYRNGESIGQAKTGHTGFPEGPKMSSSSTIGEFVRAVVTGKSADAFIEKALVESVESAGGKLVPTPLANRLIDLIRGEACLFRAGASTIPMVSKTICVPKVLSEPVCDWRAECGEIIESEPTFGGVDLSLKSCATRLEFSYELAEDSPFIPNVLGDMITESMALGVDEALMFGDGTGDMPLGAFNDATVLANQVDLGGNALTYTAIINAVCKLMRLNVPISEITLLISPATWLHLWENNKDTNGRPLPVPEVLEGMQIIPCAAFTQFDETDPVAIVARMEDVLVGVGHDTRIDQGVHTDDHWKKLKEGVRAYSRYDVAVCRPEHICRLHNFGPLC